MKGTVTCEHEFIAGQSTTALTRYCHKQCPRSQCYCGHTGSCRFGSHRLGRQFGGLSRLALCSTHMSVCLGTMQNGCKGGPTVSPHSDGTQALPRQSYSDPANSGGKKWASMGRYRALRSGSPRVTYRVLLSRTFGTTPTCIVRLCCACNGTEVCSCPTTTTDQEQAGIGTKGRCKARISQGMGRASVDHI